MTPLSLSPRRSRLLLLLFLHSLASQPASQPASLPALALAAVSLMVVCVYYCMKAAGLCRLLEQESQTEERNGGNELFMKSCHFLRTNEYYGETRMAQILSG